MSDQFVVCPKCGRELEVLPEWQGLEVSCPECQVNIPVPKTMTVDADGDLDIGVRSVHTPEVKEDSPENPLYMQESSAAAERKEQRKKQGVWHSLIKIFFSIILLAALAGGIWFGVKKYCYFRSGFGENCEIDGVAVKISGHGFYLEADRIDKPFSGRVSTELNRKKLWGTFEFKDGKAHGTAYIYKSSSSIEPDEADDSKRAKEPQNNDDVLLKMNFEHGRLISITDAEGSTNFVKYDFLKRPVYLQCKLDGLNVQWKCSYNYSGLPEKLEMSRSKKGESETTICSFNDSAQVREAVFRKNSEVTSTISFIYDNEDKLANVILYDDKGKKLREYSRTNEFAGFGPMHFIFDILKQQERAQL